MPRRFLAPLACLVLLAASAAASAAEATAVWLEGEKPTTAAVPLASVSPGKKQLLSGEAWGVWSIDADKVDATIPEAGITAAWSFTTAAAGPHEVWARIGFEFVRAPFSWRIDDGAWAECKPSDLTTDLTELDFWCEVAWIQLGKAELKPGEHRLEVRATKGKIKEKDKEVWARVLVAFDAFCIAPGAFAPNGRHAPGSSWRTERDEAAAKHVFTVPEPKADATRVSIPLKGDWEVCRNDEALPPADIAVPMTDVPKAPHWRAIAVPSDKNHEPGLVFAHRLWYRTRVQVPATAAGRSFHLVFPENNLNTTVLVNGTLCGFDKNPFARVTIDITKGVKPGQVNEVWVGIRDAWYGYTNDPSDPMVLRKCFNLPERVTSSGFQRLAYPIWHHFQSGILLTPELVMAGGAYASDVFAKPSVARKELALEVTLSNPQPAAASVEVLCEAVDRDGKVGKAFAPAKAELAAGASQVLKLAEPFADARLWWPDEPHLYRLRATVRAGGKVVDVSETEFGFREWLAKGKDFTLNGIVWHGWADVFIAGGPDAWLKFYRSSNQTVMRFWGTRWQGLPPEEALTFLDRNGVVCRRSGTFDGEAIGYMAIEENPTLAKDGKVKMDLMRNWIDQSVARTKAERNHASIMVWSIENEWLYINCINLYGGLMDEFEREVTKCSEAVLAVDPTRFTMVDGGGATKAQTLPVHGDHYVYGDPPKYPDRAYEAFPEGGGRGRWTWDQQRPRFLGEDYFANGINPFDYAYFGGEECFQGKAQTRRGAGILYRMLTEGYRWAGYGAWHFWMSQHEARDQYTSNAPLAVFVKEWDWTFGSGASVKRTLRIFNDTRFDDPVTFAWTLTVGGKPAGKGGKDYAVKAGTSEQLEVQLTLPAVEDRVEGELALTLTRGGKEVFRDVKAVSVLGEGDGQGKAPARPALSALKAGELAVYDPAGTAIAYLTERKVPFTKLDSLAPPATARVLLVGRDAIGAADAGSSVLQGWASTGRAVVVLEQREPLRYQALPADLEPSDDVGRTAFAEDLGHPVLRGLAQKDFFTWAGDHVVYRKAYRKATRGAKSLVQCHDRLADTALAEMPVDKGLLLCSQLAVGEKLATSAAARRLLLNLLDYAAGYKLEHRPVMAAIGADPVLKRELDAVALSYAPATDPVAALGKGGIAVIPATPSHLAALAAAGAKVKAHTDAGGWILLVGLTPEGLGDFNKVVGVEHMIRPFRMERVVFPASRHPLTAGMTTGDVVMQSGKKVNNFSNDVYLASDVFSYVVDIDDVAPFATFPEPKHFGYTEGGNDHNPLNMVNGFVSSDGWQMIFSIPLAHAGGNKFDLSWPKEQELVEMEWVGNGFYHLITKVVLTMDGDAKRSATIATEPTNEPQTFALDPALKGKALTIDCAEWQDTRKAAVIGIDNLRLKAKRPPEFYRDVQPLLNIGAMVAYPRGQGGLVLCNVLFQDKEAVPENEKKKRAILATLLRNLKAPFAGGRSVIAGGDLAYATVDIAKHATQYRDEKGWFGDKARSFKDLPSGAQKLAGVGYDIYRFPTSPVPDAIMLKGQGIPNDLPEAVKGIPVGRKADALFFLHTARIDQRRNPQEVKEGKRFELARYVVTYADGSTEAIPVYSEIDIEDYKQQQPRQIPGAQLAWMAKWEGSDEYAVAYSKQWNNPKPELEIRSIDIQYGEHRRGVPAVLAITAASGR